MAAKFWGLTREMGPVRVGQMDEATLALFAAVVVVRY